MKCSRRKAPMGTMPVRECKRRNRNDVPSPARRGATPGLIFGVGIGPGATGWADDATMAAPCMNRYERRTDYYPVVAEPKSRKVGSLIIVMTDTARRRAKYKCPKPPRSQIAH